MVREGERREEGSGGEGKFLAFFLGVYYSF